MYHVLSKESGMNITEETLITLDESAYKLLMERGAIRLTELTYKELKKLKRAPATTEPNNPDRYAYLVPAITASGHALCTVVAVRDTKLVEMRLEKVSPLFNKISFNN